MKHLRKFAQAGRNGDNTVGHLTTGEIVIPKSAQTPEVRALIAALLGQTGHDLGRYTVGGQDDSRNPKTGAREFYDSEPGMGSGIGEGSTQTDPVGQDGRDEGDRARAAASAAAPGVGPFGGAPVGPGYQEDAYAAQYQPRTQVKQFTDWLTSQPRELFERVGDKITDMANNPVRTGLNAIVSATPLGLANTISGWIGGPTVGGAITSAARTMTDYNPVSAVASGTPIAEIANAISTEDSDKTSPTGDKPGDKDTNSTNADTYNPLSSGPSGSGLSPLAQALAGMGIRNDGWNNWGRRKTFGPLVSSYDPNGRQYVTPWDYRG